MGESSHLDSKKQLLSHRLEHLLRVCDSNYSLELIVRVNFLLLVAINISYGLSSLIGICLARVIQSFND